MNCKIGFTIGACLLVIVIAEAQLPNAITTTDGQTYQGVSLIRVEPDGYLVNYQPVTNSNSMGIAKIKFSRLSADLRRKGDYDASEARDFELAVAYANEEYAKTMNQWSAAAKAAREANQISPEESAARVKAANALASQPPAHNGTTSAMPGGSYWGNSSMSSGLSLIHYSPNSAAGNTDPVNVNSFTQPPQMPATRSGR